MSSVVNGDVPPRMGNRSSHLAPQGLYRCDGNDQWCAVSVQNDEQWRGLVTAMDAGSWGQDERFATLVGRLHHHDEIDGRIEAWTSRLTAEEVEGRLRANGVAARRMRRINDLVDGPDVSQVFERMQDERLDSMLITGHPFLFPSGSFRTPTPAPRLGEHNQQALSDWLGLSAQEVQSLVEGEVLA